MDARSAFEAVKAIRATVPAGELTDFDGMLSARYVTIAGGGGALSVSATIEPSSTITPEPAAVSDTELLHGHLLGGFAAAYDSYTRAVADANARRNDAEQLPLTDAETIQAELVAILTPTVLAELQANVNYFTSHPETDSPQADYNIYIVPGGVTDEDNQATAHRLQQLLNPKDPDGDKDKFRTRARYIYVKHTSQDTLIIPTHHDYQIFFAPSHYNVPSGFFARQVDWLVAYNQTLKAIALQTASDEAALAVIDGLVAAGQLTNPGSRYSLARFDRRALFCYDVPSVTAWNDGIALGLDLGGSCPRRAIVVPKV